MLIIVIILLNNSNNDNNNNDSSNAREFNKTITSTGAKFWSHFCLSVLYWQGGPVLARRSRETPVNGQHPEALNAYLGPFA